MLGSGMCIMSRYPVIDIHYHPYLLNGYLHMIFHGDWFGGKGIGLCRINVNGLIVDVFTTHLHACYDPSNDKYERHRIVQAFEVANFVRITSVGADLSILAGDLNCEPGDICYKLIQLGANIKDCYSTCMTNEIEYTFNHPRNSYKNSKEPKSRLDFILYKSSKNKLVHVREHRYSLPSRVPDNDFSYSDHEPIEAVFEITSKILELDGESDNNDKELKSRHELLNVIQHSQNKFNDHLVNEQIFSYTFFTVSLFSLLFAICILWFLPFGETNIIFVSVVMAIFLCIFILTCVYILVIKCIEKNCIRGSYNQMKTVFNDHIPF
ncbi:putative neutral sphingomyelinase isoform X2 [Adelges cooleyi]|nr:putative neutral sphingomyelinase isoform X2 [Adelges cooleyi]